MVPLFVGGIFNPNGPTLLAILAVGTLAPRAVVPVVSLLLNPFAQEMNSIGELSIGDLLDPAAVAEELIGEPLGSAPSFVLPWSAVAPNRRIDVYGRWLCRHPHARSLLTDVTRHLGDPWARASAAMDRAWAAPDSSAIGRESEGDAPLTQAEGRRLATLLMSERHLKPELRAFWTAWRGSIEQNQLPRSLAESALPLDAMAPIFRKVTSACWPFCPP